MFEQYRKWAKQYGKTYGYFEGPSPVIVTSDKDILSEVFVKQFKSFHARKVSNFETKNICEKKVTIGNTSAEVIQKIVVQNAEVIQKCFEKIRINTNFDIKRNLQFNCFRMFSVVPLLF